MMPSEHHQGQPTASLCKQAMTAPVPCTKRKLVKPLLCPASTRQTCALLRSPAPSAQTCRVLAAPSAVVPARFCKRVCRAPLHLHLHSGRRAMPRRAAPTPARRRQRPVSSPRCIRLRIILLQRRCGSWQPGSKPLCRNCSAPHCTCRQARLP